MNEVDELIEKISKSNVDVDGLILQGFSKFKEYKDKGINLDDRSNSLIKYLFFIYYELGYKDIHLDNMKKSFVKKYIINENQVEGVDINTRHGLLETKGLLKMYQYMHSEDIERKFNIFTLKDLHQKLFSCSPYPEFGGTFRQAFAYLKGAKTDICDWRMIVPSLLKLNGEVLRLRELSKVVLERHSSQQLLSYLDDCSTLGTKLIKIHPFADGNGRTIRCFINKLLESAGLPSIYVNYNRNERNSYLDATAKAMDTEDYSDINAFYRYKVCDSILELDISDRLFERQSTIQENDTTDIKKVKVYTRHEER